MRTTAALLSAFIALAAAAAASPAAPPASGLIAYSDAGGSLYVASPQGKNPKTVFESDGTTTMQALDVSRDGKSVLALSTGDQTELVIVPAAGGAPVPVSGADGVTSGSFSPDGTTLVFSVDGFLSETLASGIYTVSSSGGTPKAVVTSPDGAIDSLPSHSPDGTKIAFVRDAYDDQNVETVTLELIASSGGSPKALATGLTPSLASGNRLAFSPDGTKLAYAGDYTTPGIFTVPVAGGTAAKLTSDYDYWPSFSTDGSQIYFSRDATSTHSDANATNPVAPADNDVYELWTMKKDGTAPTVVAEGDFEDLAVAAIVTTAVATTAPPTVGATSISVKVKGSRYTIRWKGAAKSWTVTLRVGKKKVSAKVAGSVHSKVFVLHGAHGRATALVKTP